MVIFFVLISASAQAQWESDVQFPSEFAIRDTCKLTKISQTLTIKTSSEIPIKIYSLNLSPFDNALFINAKQISVSDTFSISKSNPLVILIKLNEIPKVKDGLSVSYVYDNGEKYGGSINFHLGDLVIKNNDVEIKKEQIIDFSKMCSDTIRIYFPYGGTASTISIYKAANRKNIFRQVGYSHGDAENYLVFAKADIGKYYVKFSSCHWGSNFWLVVK